ncbi:MAG: HAMP domain-containing histidine kinase [Clostridiales bacterium]|nr:HAMP domain-containing histidine kinase [Clostridiales bacterium]
MGRFKRKLSFYILTRFVFWLVVFTASLGICFVFAIKFGRDHIWQPSFLYGMLHFMYTHTGEFFIICWTVGFILIFIGFWVKTLGYLEKVIRAAEALFRSENELIVLPDVLKEVENQMNQIKFNIKESERAAKDAEQRKNDLIVYLAHDLKTPLTSVIGHLNLLKDEKDISESTREKYISVSLEKAWRLEELIDEFFEITRHNLHELSLDKAKINLTLMLEQIVHESRPMLSEKGLACELSVEQDVMLECDANKLTRVFDNLMKNAASYSFKGTVVRISGERRDGNAVIRFRNEGSTVPPEKLDRLFEQFYRAEAARATGTGGAGLGLAIARDIVHLHGGTITASSENDVIEFTVTLPGAI